MGDPLAGGLLYAAPLLSDEMSVLLSDEMSVRRKVLTDYCTMAETFRNRLKS